MTGDWWTACNCPFTGCPRLALPREQRPEGCRRCWLEGYLHRFPTIHGTEIEEAIHPVFGHHVIGDPEPWSIQLHPNRLAACLRTRKPQRYGWILGEPAAVASMDPAYLDECVDSMAATHHGVGMPTSDPAGLVPWARARAQGGLRAPQNVLVLISASTQPELDERVRHAEKLRRLRWRWGVHAEPLLGPLNLTEAIHAGACWFVSGVLKGHEAADERPPPQEVDHGEWGAATVSYRTEVDLRRSIRDQAEAAGVPFWLKSLGRRRGRVLDGREWNGLPDGWPR